MRSLFGDGREHPPGSIARIMRLDCDTGPGMRRSEQQSAEMRQADNFFFVLMIAARPGRGREIAADREREQVLIVW